MKILYHHRTLGDGAEGIHIKEMVNAFRVLGHHVKVVGPVGEISGNEYDRKISLFSRIKSMMPRFVYELLEIAYNIHGYFSLRKEILRDRPDFIYDRYMIFNASAVLIGKRYNIPVILEINAPLALERSEEPDERLYLKRLAFFLEKWICSNSYLTIAVSTPLKEYLVSQGVPERKIVVMPNGVNPDKFKPKGEKSRELLKECGFGTDDIIVGFVGILRPWHGIELLLDAFRQVSSQVGNLRLLLVGDGPIRSVIEERVQELDISSKVHITGRVPHERVPDYINLFDIAVSPKATFYASPMKILEYMAMGKTVVAPNMINIRDIINPGKTGYLFKQGSQESLAEVLLELSKNKEYRRNLGKLAKNKILECLNWTQNARLVLDIIEGQKLKSQEHNTFQKTFYPFLDILNSCNIDVTGLKVIKQFERRLSKGYLCQLENSNKSQEDLLFIKIYKKQADVSWLEKRVQKEFEETQRGYQCFTSQKEFKIVKPICALPASFTLVFRGLRDAISFEDLIRKKGKFINENNELLNIAYKAGKFLAIFHSTGVIDRTFSKSDINNLREYLYIRTRKIGSYLDGSDLEAIIQKIYLKYSNRILEYGLRENSFMVRNHGDFSPGNLLIKEGTLYLIDFADSKVGPRYYDIANFFCYLDMLVLNKPYFRISLINKMKQQFKKGYETIFLPIDEPCLNFFLMKPMITNLMTQFFDCADNQILRLIYKPRIKKYVKALKVIADQQK